MNNSQIEKITLMRQQGASCAVIASTIGVSVNTIKSYCRRNKIEQTSVMADETSAFCRNCGAELHLLPKRKPKQFCSDKCRMSWWNAHPELLRHKTVTECKCRQCGSKFNSYSKRERKFCSLGCYRKYRSELAGGSYDK